MAVPADEDAGLLEVDTGAAVDASSSNIDLVRSFSDVGGTGTGTGPAEMKIWPLLRRWTPCPHLERAPEQSVFSL